VKVAASSPDLAELVRIARASGARIVDVSSAVMILVLTDAPARVAAFVARLRPFGIVELIQSGRIAMALGSLGKGQRRGDSGPEPEQAPLMNPYPFRWQADGTSDDEAA